MVDEVHVHEADFLEFFGQVGVSLVHFGVVRHVGIGAPGRKADAGAFGANGVGYAPGHLQYEAGAIPHAAAVLVGALVGMRVQELREQVAVGAVHFYAVKPGFDAQLGCFDVLVAHAGQLVGTDFAGLRVVEHLLLVGPHLALGQNGRRGYYFGARGQVEVVRDAAGVH